MACCLLRISYYLSALYLTRFASHKILLRELFPFTFVLLIWLIQVLQGFLQQDWGQYSVYPRTLSGLRGIVTSPLLHAGWEHLLGNTLPLLILGFLLFNSYKTIAGKVFWLIYLLNGTLLWLFARQSIHLGASGVIYGLAAFLFFSGMIRRNPQLAMISMLIVFLYGSMVWGIFPFDPQVSWEAHLYGGLTGLILAVALRKEGPQPPKYFEDEKDEEEIPFEEVIVTPGEKNPVEEMNPAEDANPASQVPPPPLTIVYTYREKDKEE